MHRLSVRKTIYNPGSNTMRCDISTGDYFCCSWPVYHMGHCLILKIPYILTLDQISGIISVLKMDNLDSSHCSNSLRSHYSDYTFSQIIWFFFSSIFGGKLFPYIYLWLTCLEGCLNMRVTIDPAKLVCFYKYFLNLCTQVQYLMQDGGF